MAQWHQGNNNLVINDGASERPSRFLTFYLAEFAASSCSPDDCAMYIKYTRSDNTRLRKIVS